jgi:hypothetical protein
VRVKLVVPLVAPLLSAGEAVTGRPLLGLAESIVSTYRVGGTGGGALFAAPPQAISESASKAASPRDAIRCKLFLPGSV